MLHVFLTTSQHPLYCGTCFLNYHSTSFVLWIHGKLCQHHLYCGTSNYQSTSLYSGTCILSYQSTCLCIVVHVLLTISQHPLFYGTCSLNNQLTTFVLWYMFSQLPVNIPCIMVHVFLTTGRHPLYCGTCFLNYQSTSFVLRYMFS